METGMETNDCIAAGWRGISPESRAASDSGGNPDPAKVRQDRPVERASREPKRCHSMLQLPKDSWICRYVHVQQIMALIIDKNTTLPSLSSPVQAQPSRPNKRQRQLPRVSNVRAVLPCTHLHCSTTHNNIRSKPNPYHATHCVNKPNNPSIINRQSKKQSACP